MTLPRFTDEQRKTMLRAINVRRGRWSVDPNSEVESIGDNIGLGREESHELFKRLVDEGYIDPGRVYGAAGASAPSERTGKTIGHGENTTAVGDDIKPTGKGLAELE